MADESEHFEYEPRGDCPCGAFLDSSSATVVKRFGWGDITFRRCFRCASWCQSPMLSTTSLRHWFESEEYSGSERKPGAAYSNYAADEEGRLIEARDRYYRDLHPLLPERSRVLEIGCATGSLLSVLRDHGHEVVGIDLSRRFVDLSASVHRLNVILGDFMEADFPVGSFDAIIAMGTVGNFRSPSEFFAKARLLLRPGGMAVFNFPDAASGWVRFLYRSRFWMFTPSVRTFMSARGCVIALERAGFDLVEMRQDVQRPSLRKLLHHARASGLLRVLDGLGLGGASLPVALPMPSVRSSGSTGLDRKSAFVKC